jgi:SAM-dependent methyltransferase
MFNDVVGFGPMTSIKARLRQNRSILTFYRWWRRMVLDTIPNIAIWRIIPAYVQFISEWRHYRRLGGQAMVRNWYPCLLDKTTVTPLDAYYFYQDTWLARKVFQSNPSCHVDIGSSAELVGILSQFTQVISVDIRPLPVSLPNLETKQGSILALPFPNGGVTSISSICVIEHVGLGRYGDPIDPRGTDKAIVELLRVLSPGGDLYISVPIESSSQVYFNAHRAFNPDELVNKLAGLDLMEVAFVQKDGVRLPSEFDISHPSSELTIGLFHLKRPSRTDTGQ